MYLKFIFRGIKFEWIPYAIRGMYRLELQVTPEATQFYPPLGTVEDYNNDNAGYDLKIVAELCPTKSAKLVPLGVKARLTSLVTGLDCHFSLEPRSSIYKTGFIMANSRGIIDRSYRGELKAPVVSVGDNDMCVEAGTRLFQIIAPDMGHIKQVRYVADLPATLRGEGGFGSTGAK